MSHIDVSVRIVNFKMQNKSVEDLNIELEFAQITELASDFFKIYCDQYFFVAK